MYRYRHNTDVWRIDIRITRYRYEKKYPYTYLDVYTHTHTHTIYDSEMVVGVSVCLVMCVCVSLHRGCDLYLEISIFGRIPVRRYQLYMHGMDRLMVR